MLESFVIPAEVVVAHLLDRHQALKNGVHVAVERVVLQADDALLQVLHLLVAAGRSGDEVGGRLDLTALGRLRHRLPAVLFLSAHIDLLNIIMVLVDNDVPAVVIVRGGLRAAVSVLRVDRRHLLARDDRAYRGDVVIGARQRWTVEEGQQIPSLAGDYLENLLLF